MRKLISHTMVTLDGFMAGPNGEMDWLKFPWTDDVGAYIDYGALAEAKVAAAGNSAEVPVAGAAVTT